MRRAVLAITFALSTPAFPQGTTGELAGMVVNAVSQTPIPEAVVVARSGALPGEQSAVTDGSGAFEMSFLPPGTYSLAVKCDGCVPYSPEGVVLKGGKTRVRIAVVPVPSAEAITAGAVEFDESMTAPAMISGPAPEYTPEAVERGVQGNMEVRCVVTAEGHVRACKVLKGLPLMNAPVIQALEKRVYKPALARGKAVDVYYTFNLRLKLPAGTH
jgi:TonB family protein